jgi:hypothetical protein
VVEKAVEQVVDIDPVMLVVQTQRRRNLVKKPPFEARKNQFCILLAQIYIYSIQFHLETLKNAVKVVGWK